MSRRRGFTLVELLVALVLAGAISGIAVRLVIGTQRGAIAAIERAILQEQLRAGLLLASAELRELGGDIATFSDSTIVYRATRGLGFLCAAASTELRYRADLAFGFRLPQAGRDSFLVFAAPSTGGAGGEWVALPISSVDAGSTCAGVPAIALGTSIDPVALPLARLAPGRPIRLFEVAALELYGSGAERWLGVRAVSNGEAVQPALGPLAPGGLTFSYLDDAGLATADRDRIRSVGLVLRARTSRAVHGTGAGGAPAVRRDSASGLIRLRNTVRP